jgi:hypothetical protein
MSSYFSIEYTGSSFAFTRFIDSKEWNVEMKHVAANKVFIKANSDVAEEILFFNGSEFNDTGGKIERVYCVFKPRFQRSRRVSTTIPQKMVLR